MALCDVTYDRYDGGSNLDELERILQWMTSAPGWDMPQSWMFGPEYKIPDSIACEATLRLKSVQQDLRTMCIHKASSSLLQVQRKSSS
jgi:hypothetical protein